MTKYKSLHRYHACTLKPFKDKHGVSLTEMNTLDVLYFLCNTASFHKNGRKSKRCKTVEFTCPFCGTDDFHATVFQMFPFAYLHAKVQVNDVNIRLFSTNSCIPMGRDKVSVLLVHICNLKTHLNCLAVWYVFRNLLHQASS